MQITFDKTLKQQVYNALRPRVHNRDCPFCEKPVTAKNFAGAIHYKGAPRFMHRSIFCLFGYVDYERRLKKLAKVATK